MEKEQADAFSYLRQYCKGGAQFAFEEHRSGQKSSSTAGEMGPKSHSQNQCGRSLSNCKNMGRLCFFKLSTFWGEPWQVNAKEKKSISYLNSPNKNSRKIYVARYLSCAGIYFWRKKFSKAFAGVNSFFCILTQLEHNCDTERAPPGHFARVSAWPVQELVPRHQGEQLRETECMGTGQKLWVWLS